MSKQIWKYELRIGFCNKINIPKNSRNLSIQIQNNKPCLWVLVNPENEVETRTFITYGTGWDMEDTDKEMYLGTVLVDNGKYAWHVFEILK